MYNYNPGLERINNQIAELEKMKAQIQTPAINQTFQLASPTNIKYANSIDDVNKEFVYGETSGSYPNNILLITTPGHILCSKYGVIYDTFDPRERKTEFAWIVK